MNCVPHMWAGQEVIRDHEGGSSSGQISVSGRTALALPPEMHMVCTHYDELSCQTEIISEDRNLQRQFVCDING